MYYLESQQLRHNFNASVHYLLLVPAILSATGWNKRECSNHQNTHELLVYVYY